MAESKSATVLGAMLDQWLGEEAAPMRPVESSGILVKPQRRTRNRSAIFAACEKNLVEHLRSACLWPAREYGRSWRIGDYSTYVLEFSPSHGIEVYVQVWSEPGESAVTFQAYSDAWILPRDQTIDIRKQEMLRDHGFEISHQPQHYEKQVTVEGMKGVRHLAREAVAVLCKLFGYDGRVPLTYRLHLGTRLRPGWCFTSIASRELAKLMRRWGFAVEEEESGGKPNLLSSSVGSQPFLVALAGEQPEGVHEYAVLGLRAFFRFEGGVPGDLANTISREFATVQASVDEEGDLVVQAPILLHGGVTEANLEMNFHLWRQTLEAIVRGLE